MRCMISQPRFFPVMHYLHRMKQSDVFVVLDTVQFTPRHEENRAKLKGPQGTQWLTVPVERRGREQRIVDTRIHAEQPWREAAVKTLFHLYGKAPHYEEHAPEIVEILRAPHETLTELDRASWEPGLRMLGIGCRIVLASELPVTGRGPELLLDLCRHLGADVYLSGPDGKKYLDVGHFAANGVEVCYHEYLHPPYRQRFGDYVPFLSYLDVLFNTGLDPAQMA